jgi:hypothetical protein
MIVTSLVLIGFLGCRLQRVDFVEHHLLVRNPNPLRRSFQQDSVVFAVFNVIANQAALFLRLGDLT